MQAPAFELDPPRFATGKAMLVAGLRGHFTYATWAGIPAQWERLIAHGKIPGMVGSAHYGLCFNQPSGIDYLCGVEVADVAGLPNELPSEFSHCKIPGQRYAVFSHRGHVSKLHDTLDAIHRTWAPDHELIRPSDGAPDFFERYGERFDPRTGMGDIQVWIPIMQ
jgi:AraC family transcriptional regulator